MKFSTRMDTDLDAATLFAALSDFDRLAQIIRRRRAQVTRRDPASGEGMGWDLGFDWRGRHRSFCLTLSRHDPDEALQFTGTTEGFQLCIDLAIVALTRTRSRVICQLDARPRTMKTRLIVQTAKLGKAQLDQRFVREVRGLVTQLTDGGVTRAARPVTPLTPVTPVTRLAGYSATSAAFCDSRSGSAG